MAPKFKKKSSKDSVAAALQAGPAYTTVPKQKAPSAQPTEKKAPARSAKAMRDKMHQGY